MWVAEVLSCTRRTNLGCQSDNTNMTDCNTGELGCLCIIVYMQAAAGLPSTVAYVEL